MSEVDTWDDICKLNCIELARIDRDILIAGLMPVSDCLSVSDGSGREYVSESAI